MDSSQTRRPCFRDEDDDGLASVADMEAGFSGNNHPFFNRSSMGFSRRSSLRNLCSLSPRSGRVFDSRFEEHHQPHFLENCFLCKKSLGGNSDIFMYRGDTPFCSEECRQEQIDNDEAKEKKRSLSSSIKLRKNEQTRSATSPSKSKNYPFRTGTVVAA